MILRATDGGLILIPQTEHARICGDMARAWGNAGFEPVRPPGQVALAAADHDNGWAEWDSEPRLNPETGRPFTYIDIPIEQHLEIYRRGIRRAVERDPYAGLLVSLHGSLLYSRFRSGQPGAEGFLAEQAAMRARLISELDRDPELRPYCREPALTANRDLLFGLDAVSLFLCHGEPFLDRVEVPAGRSTRRVSLRLEGGDEGWRIDPYPFREAPLGLAVEATRLAGDRFGDERAMRRALDGARRIRLEFSLAGPMPGS